MKWVKMEEEKIRGKKTGEGGEKNLKEVNNYDYYFEDILRLILFWNLTVCRRILFPSASRIRRS
jgi:hypothetical protein